MLFVLGLGACGRLNIDAIGDAGTDADARIDANPITNPPPKNFTTGTRLRPNTYRSGDVVYRRNWHDTMLGVDCVAGVMTDGVTRCVPQDAVTQTYYGDGACTEPLGYRDPALDPCGPLTYSAAPTDGVWIARTVIGPHAGDVYANFGGTCMTITAGGLLDLGPVVPPSTFLAGHEERTRNHDLSYAEIAFDDGSRELEKSIYDHVHDETCGVRTVSGDEAICVPPTTGYGELYYKDAACTQGVAGLAPTALGLFMLGRDDICGEEDRLFRAGAPFTAPVYELTNAGCAPAATPRPTYELVRVPTDAYPRFQRALRPGSGVVREPRWTTTDGFDFASDRLWNDQRHTWCMPIVNGDTPDVICAPYPTSQAQSVYTDAACTISGDLVVPACVETGGALYYPPVMSLESCYGRRYIPAVLDRPVTDPAFMRSEHGCTAIPASTALNAQGTAVGVNAADYPVMVPE